MKALPPRGIRQFRNVDEVLLFFDCNLPFIQAPCVDLVPCTSGRKEWTSRVRIVGNDGRGIELSI